MRSLAEAGLDGRRRKLVESALRTDPALAEELELIAAELGAEAGRCFWVAFADRCDGVRPAAAVLPALERAACG
jgi:hypothetical protein